MVWTKSVLSEKYLLRNISVDGGVVWDNSDKVWCNILEMKRMRSQGSHHYPLWTKKGDANMGFVLRGIIQLIQESICQLKSVLPFHFQSCEDLIYFHSWPKLWGFPRLHSRALLSRVDSRYFAWNTWEPLICHLLCSHVENFWDIWRSRFLMHFEYKFDSVDRKEVGCYNYLLDGIWFDLEPHSKHEMNRVWKCNFS